MSTIILRPAEPERDFRQLAVWFSLLEDESSSEAGLREYYEKQQVRITQKVAEDGHGALLGFYWAIRAKQDPSQMRLFLYVKPEARGAGVGCRLYDDVERVVETGRAKKLQVNIPDTSEAGRSFAEQRGFTERVHQIAMAMDLKGFDERAHDVVVAKLKGEGFQFTSMGALGDTEEARRKLYDLNQQTSLDIPGREDEAGWTSFEDFRASVCEAAWYKPGGQRVVIEASTGHWAAMSAITRLEGNSYAYNLHTGVDRGYRGRKLGQAVKVQALRYAREILRVYEVRTHHTAQNLPMIAIDRKLGYQPMPGYYVMQKLYA